MTAPSAVRAAVDLAAAVSMLLLLQRCERATGTRMITREDEIRMKQAGLAWESAR